MFTRPIQTVGGMLMFTAGYAGASIQGMWPSIAAVVVISLLGWVVLDYSREAED